MLSVHWIYPTTRRSDTPTPHAPFSFLAGYPCGEEPISPSHAVDSTPLSSHTFDVPVACCQQAGAFAIDASEDPHETSVLVEAVRSGSGAMINTVAAAMFDLLPEEKVCVLLCSNGF